MTTVKDQSSSLPITEYAQSLIKQYDGNKDGRIDRGRGIFGFLTRETGRMESDGLYVTAYSIDKLAKETDTNKDFFLDKVELSTFVAKHADLDNNKVISLGEAVVFEENWVTQNKFRQPDPPLPYDPTRP